MSTPEGSDGRVWNSPLRKKFAKRAQEQTALVSGITPKSLLKSPSQKKSERGKAKELKRAGIERKNKTEERTIPSDCRGCADDCKYNRDLDLCPKQSMVLRCKHCGQKVRFRVIIGLAWEYCPVCRS